MNIKGTFLVFGPECEPAVVILSGDQLASLDAALGIASKHGKDSLRHEAYRQAFRMPAHWAVPCWNRDAMITLAREYTGPHQERVRGLAACNATGTPYGPQDANPGRKGTDDGSGGQHARLQPEKPRRPPGGARVMAQPTTAGVQS